jgi:hypothetical protein
MILAAAQSLFLVALAGALACLAYLAWLSERHE